VPSAALELYRRAYQGYSSTVPGFEQAVLREFMNSGLLEEEGFTEFVPEYKKKIDQQKQERDLARKQKEHADRNGKTGGRSK